MVALQSPTLAIADSSLQRSPTLCSEAQNHSRENSINDDGDHLRQAWMTGQVDDLLIHPVRFDRCADTVTQGGLYLLTSVAASIKEAKCVGLSRI